MFCKCLHSVGHGLQYPSEASNGSFFYYSSEQGPAHGIWLSPYVSNVHVCCCMSELAVLMRHWVWSCALQGPWRLWL